MEPLRRTPRIVLALLAVTGPTRLDLDLGRPSRHGPLFRVTTGYHQALACGVYQVGVGVQVGLPFREQGSGKRLTGGEPAQFVEANGGRLSLRARKAAMD